MRGCTPSGTGRLIHAAVSEDALVVVVEGTVVAVDPVALFEVAEWTWIWFVGPPQPARPRAKRPTVAVAANRNMLTALFHVAGHRGYERA